MNRLTPHRDSSNGPQIEIAVVLDFHKRILFSDEAHFWLNGYVNKQNCRIWSEASVPSVQILGIWLAKRASIPYPVSRCRTDCLIIMLAYS
ncbi:hypothetical protein TNCV_1491341 [Trichonephila clavipes]|nr:hypothetical protein TNCV_1491341 [Trichonephila clavipes]